MTDLLAELDDQMRAERMQQIWNRHGKTIIACLLGIVLATALYSGHKEWDLRQKTKDTEAMFSVLKHEDFPNNVTAESKLDLRPSMRAIVMLNAAGAYLQKEEGKEIASSLYEALNTDNSIPEEFRDLATLSQVRLKLSMETIQPADALEKLKPLLDNDKGAYVSQALIEAATLHAALKEYGKALALLDRVNARVNLPDTIYLKARTLVHVYSLKQSKAEEK